MTNLVPYYIEINISTIEYPMVMRSIPPGITKRKSYKGINSLLAVVKYRAETVKLTKVTMTKLDAQRKIERLMLWFITMT